MVPFTLSARIICRCSGLCFQLGVQRCSELRRVKYWELCVLFTLTVKVRTPCWCSVSVMSEFASPWTAACQASLSFTISWSLLKFMSIESVIISNHLILCSPLLLLPAIFLSIRIFSNELAFHIRWPKYWNFSFSISCSNEYSGLISFRKLDWLVCSPCSPRDSQQYSPAPPFKSTNSWIFSLLYGLTLTSVHDY